MVERSTEALRERGVRVTPQRAGVWGVLLESGGHLTAEEVWERAGGALPGLELSTVYRALDALGEAGLVVESRLPEGPRVFEAHVGQHSHLLCEVCRIFHLPSGADAGLLEALEGRAKGFAVRELRVVAVGVCASCAQSEGQAST
ncbi:MAG: transcriptional repressor [Rubrobacteraceae bacterium]|nr:transcriptional repressor [Rubrobacteraceae bacterium]